MKRLFQSAAIAFALSAGSMAQGASLGLDPVSSPQLTASNVFVDNDPDFLENLFASGSGASFNGSGSFDFTLNVFYESFFGPESGTLDIDEGVDRVYAGTLIARGYSDDRMEFLFSTDFDTLGIGGQALVFLNGDFGSGDPFGKTFTGLDAVTYATATIAAPIPLPLSGVLLLSGMGGMLLVARRRKAAA